MDTYTCSCGQVYMRIDTMLYWHPKYLNWADKRPDNNGYPIWAYLMQNDPYEDLVGRYDSNCLCNLDLPQ